MFVSAFTAQAAGLVELGRLREVAEQARQVAEGNRIRTALLAAVSHDLRTPLAGVKAAVSALRHPGLALSEADRAELLATIEESADRLDGLVGNLLDMSRLQADTVRPLLRAVHLEEVIPAALAGVPSDRVDVLIPDELPAAWADAGLLERVLANVVENAVRHAPAGQPVRVLGAAAPGGVVARVVDAGPGVAPGDRDAIFAPFQRLGDAPAGSGVGLGLAVARGFAQVMGGRLEAEETPGGGLTMVLTLPQAST